MKIIACGLAFVLTVMLASPCDAAPCTVCHSKNPKMVKMHEELRGKGCFQCHNFEKKKSPGEIQQQQTSDPLCLSCHKK